MSRRVVITGAGAVTPLGATLEATRAALADGRSALDLPRTFGTNGFRERRAGEIRDFDPRPYFRAPKALKLADRPLRFAVPAAAMALADAKWAGDGVDDRLGVLIGASGHDLLADQLSAALAPDGEQRAVSDVPFFADRVLHGLTPLWLITVLPNMMSAQVAIQFDAAGPNSTIMSDAAAGLQAIGEAAAWIRNGEADAALAGGADSALNPFAYAALQQASDREPGGRAAGVVPAEGAAVVLLEERDHAIQRGARIQAEVIGYASAGGDEHCERRAASEALRDAGLTPSDVDVVAGDASRQLGHTLAASGPIDLAVSLRTPGAAANGSIALVVSRGFTRVAAAIALRS